MMLTFSQAEAEVVKLMNCGQHYFNPFMNSQLWTGAKRLEKRGAIKASPVANCFDIACPECCHSGYTPCAKHPIIREAIRDVLTPIGVNQYLSSRGIREHRLDFEEQRELASRA